MGYWRFLAEIRLPRSGRADRVERRCFSVGLALLWVVLAFGPSSLLLAAPTTRVSVASDGTEGDEGSYGGVISADGRHVAFLSQATNLVADDTNGAEDIFVRDLATGLTVRASVASDGAEGDGDSWSCTIGADGRYVAFSSCATNLIAGDTNDLSDVFVHDSVTGQTWRVSVASDGTEADGCSFSPALSADGRYVAFISCATDLVADDTNDRPDAFLHDRLTGETQRVSLVSDGAEADGCTLSAVISAEGRQVAFVSCAANLVATDTNGVPDVFVHDLVTGETERVSLASDGTEADGCTVSAAVTPDGECLAFASEASNLVVGDANDRYDVFLRDRVTGQTERVSVSTGEVEGDAGSWSPALSGDGRYVAFSSDASNLVVADTNAQSDIFLRDRLAGRTERVSVSSTGAEGNQGSYAAALPADGRQVAFWSSASNLVTDDTNTQSDIFVRERPVADFCGSSTSGTAPLTVAFTDLSTGGVTGWAWDFGDGLTSADQASSHEYGLAGSYAVTLTVTDGAGWDSETKVAYVVVSPPAPTADFLGAPTSGVAPLEVSFTDLSANRPAAWAWGFGDGGTSADQHPGHTYYSPGCYDVTLTASNDSGSDSETKQGYITVAAPAPAAAFSAAPTRGKAPLVVSFTNESANSPTSWNWDFGDGGISTQQHPVHQYAAAGIYDVSLTVSGLGGRDGESAPSYIRVSFSDVPIAPDDPEDYWALDYILACVEAGIVDGYPDVSYRPALPVARDQMAVFVSRALAGGDALVPTGPATAAFTDIPTDHWAFRYVAYAVDTGVTGGYSDGTYRPTVTVDRGQMAVFIARAMCGGDAFVPTGPATAFFPDVPTDHWAFKYVEYIRGESVSGGYPDGTYRPLVACTRDQMAVYVARAFGLAM